MKLEGSAIIQIECRECLTQSDKFRVYLYRDEGGQQWDGTLPEGWTVVEEAELIPNDNRNLPFIAIGGCNKHPVEEA